MGLTSAEISDFIYTEAEYVAVPEASKEIIWLKGLLRELGLKQENNVLFSDSQSAIHIAKNPVLEDGELLLEKILGSKNPAYMLTKTVIIEKLKLCSTSVGLHT